MAEKFTIKEILDYPDKIYNSLSDINLEGILTVTMTPKKMTRKKDNQIFFAQFVVVKDDSGEIGVNMAVGEEDKTLPQSAKGKKVKVEGATTDTYKDKEGKIKRVLKGRVSLLGGQVEKTSSGGNGKEGYDGLPDGRFVVSREEWAKKDRTLTRVAIVKSLIEAGKHPDPDTIEEAIQWFAWVYYSEDKEPEIEKPKEKKKTKLSRKNSVEQTVDKDFSRKKMENNLLKLYTQACKLKLFDTNYDLSKWMDEQFGKKTVGSLADDQIVDAVRLMGEKIKEKEGEKK